MPHAETKKKYVIMLHGLGRTRRSMSKLAGALEKHGYTVINHSYPSTKDTIENLAPAVIDRSLRECDGDGDGEVNFVTHSMGAIILRYYLVHYALPRLGRVVMLAPPNKGSAIVDRLHSMPALGWVNCPALYQLKADVTSLPNTLGKANFDLGVIAGNQSIDPVLSLFLEKPHEGKVSVASTMLEGMSDHIVLPTTHPFIMRNNAVIEQTAYFLKNGRFFR
jgi:triacylglycerol lipase